jgi:hypothetical protein
MSEYRDYNLVGDGAFSMLTIKNKGSGPVPKPLQGMFSTEFMAKRAIDLYLNKKGKTNGSTKRTNTG